MCNIRSDAALAAAWQILAMVGIPATPSTLDRAAFAVLEAIYEVEGRLAEQPRPIRRVCPGCLLPLAAAALDAAGGTDRCPGCGRVLPPPSAVARN